MTTPAPPHCGRRKLCLSTEFRPIVGNAGCFVRITGATNLTHADDARQNAAEVIIGLLRWENETIGRSSH
ncbi:hypothetical protein PINS_up022284 [Pythium insidiosum]|nr:hypothetical protein PINS_up022284 [Pythium insidiosum]